MPGAHSILSPSSASRWLACPPSAKINAALPETSSAAADEGTLAHRYGELLIGYGLGRIKRAAYRTELAAIKADPLYKKEMDQYCSQYATYVLEIYNGAVALNGSAVIYVEQWVSLEQFIPEPGVGGTSDTGIVSGRTLDVVDLKYGKGVEVNYVDNTQLKIYALGVLALYEDVYEIDTVRMHIYQPRIGNVGHYELSTADLHLWAATVLQPAANYAYHGGTDNEQRVAGEHCRFCKVSGSCRVNMEYNLSTVQLDKTSEDLTDEEVAGILDHQATFTNWLNAVTGTALHKAIHAGKKWPGYKLVEGRSNRILKDVDAVKEALYFFGYTAEEIHKPAALLPLSELDAYLGKSVFKALLADFVIKPPGKLTLAPRSDKRPEYNSLDAARADFEDYDENTAE